MFKLNMLVLAVLALLQLTFAAPVQEDIGVSKTYNACKNGGSCAVFIVCKDKTDQLDYNTNPSCHHFGVDYNHNDGNDCSDLPGSLQGSVTYATAWPGTNCHLFEETGCKGSNTQITWPEFSYGENVRGYSSFRCKQPDGTVPYRRDVQQPGQDEQLQPISSSQDNDLSKVYTACSGDTFGLDYIRCAIFIACQDKTSSLDFRKNPDCHRVATDYHNNDDGKDCADFSTPLEGNIHYLAAWPGANCYLFSEAGCKGSATQLMWPLYAYANGAGGWSSYRCKKPIGTLPQPRNFKQSRDVQQPSHDQIISNLMVPPAVPTTFEIIKKGQKCIDSYITCGDKDPCRAGYDNTCATITLCQKPTQWISNEHDCHIFVSKFDECIDLPNSLNDRMTYGLAMPGSGCEVFDNWGCKGDSTFIDYPFHVTGLDKSHWSSFRCKDLQRSTTLITTTTWINHYSTTLPPKTVTAHTTSDAQSSAVKLLKKNNELNETYIYCGDLDPQRPRDDKNCAVTTICREQTTHFGIENGCYEFITPFYECNELPNGIARQVHYAITNPGGYCYFYSEPGCRGDNTPIMWPSLTSSLQDQEWVSFGCLSAEISGPTGPPTAQATLRRKAVTALRTTEAQLTSEPAKKDNELSAPIKLFEEGEGLAKRAMYDPLDYCFSEDPLACGGIDMCEEETNIIDAEHHCTLTIATFDYCLYLPVADPRHPNWNWATTQPAVRCTFYNGSCRDGHCGSMTDSCKPENELYSIEPAESGHLGQDWWAFKCIRV